MHKAVIIGQGQGPPLGKSFLALVTPAPGLVACSRQSYYLNQCWFKVKWSFKENFKEIWIEYKHVLSIKYILKSYLQIASHLV